MKNQLKVNNRLMELVQNKEYAAFLKVIIGVAALFAGAQLIIPLKPVPITFQTVVISLIAFTYSPRLSFITVLTYVFAGLVGLPMFTNFGSGLAKIMGPTGGYLFGFLVATPLMSYLRLKVNHKFLSVMVTCLAGHFVIYFFGISWLATIIGLEQAIYSGFIIYIPTGLVKIAIFSYLYSYIKGRN